jgi:hypothetical protein
MRYQARSKNVVLTRKEQAGQIGGIHVPESSQFDEWIITSVGPSCSDVTEEDIDSVVIIDKFNSQQFKVPGESKELIVVHEKHIRVTIGG